MRRSAPNFLDFFISQADPFTADVNILVFQEMLLVRKCSAESHGSVPLQPPRAPASGACCGELEGPPHNMEVPNLEFCKTIPWENSENLDP